MRLFQIHRAHSTLVVLAIQNLGAISEGIHAWHGLRTITGVIRDTWHGVRHNLQE